MAYIGPLGIPYSVWLGSGVGWDDLSRSAALAWQEREHARCGKCGTVPREWKALDWDGEPIVDDHGNQMHTDEPPFLLVDDVCPCCAGLDHAHQAVKGSPADVPGHLFRFIANPAASPIDRPTEEPSES